MSTQVVTVGLDEVGYGSIYGPLVVGCVANTKGWADPEVIDSKKIKSAKRRHQIATRIKEHTHSYVDFTEACHIDRFGIANCLGMAFQRLIAKIEYVLTRIDPRVHLRVVVDGNRVPDLTVGHGHIEFMPKADAKVFEVGCASIIAKVARDTWVRHQVEINPDLQRYGLDSNVGYGTEEHVRALFEHGLTEHHRRSFCETAKQTALAKGRV